MWRSASLLIGALVVSCWRGNSGDTTIDNRAQRGEHDLTAAYYCSIADGGYHYPGYPCAIRKVDGHWMLAKLAGSQRFRGEIRAQGAGFTFAGEFYCPWGDCSQPLHGVFEPTGHGALRGKFRDAQLIVTLVPAPDSAFGGASYGGDGYGGFGYGGATYGALPSARNHRR